MDLSAVEAIVANLRLPVSSDDENSLVWATPEEFRGLQLPESFGYLIDDYTIALDADSPRDESMIRLRLNAILFMTLAEMKRTVKDASSALQNPRIPFWRVQDRLAVQLSDGSILETHVHYALSHETDNYWPDVPNSILSTNLIVVRSDALLEGESDEALGPLALFHVFKKHVFDDGQIYGICTDSYMWTFMHISDDGRISKLLLKWEDDQNAIIAQLCKIFKQAMALCGTQWINSDLRTRIEGCFTTLNDEEIVKDREDD